MKIVISTANGTSTHEATDTVQALSFVEKALNEIGPGRVVAIIEGIYGDRKARK